MTSQSVLAVAGAAALLAIIIIQVLKRQKTSMFATAPVPLYSAMEEDVRPRSTSEMTATGGA